MALPLASAPVARSVRILVGVAAALAALAVGPAAAEAPRISDLPLARPGVSAPAAAMPGGRAAPSTYSSFGTTEGHVAAARLTGEVGYALVSLDDGKVIEARGADHGFPPASVTKAVTALYALETLGPEHRFETRLVAGGTLAPGGTLKGTLTLVGGGDPELDTDALAELAAQAAQRGLRRLEGAFLVDASELPAIPRIDPGQPEHVAYNPAVSALNLNFNRVLFKWEGDGADRRLTLQARARRHSPEVSAISIALAPRAAPLFARRDLQTGDMGSEEAWQVNEGALNRKGQRWLPVRRPDIYAGDAFRSLARDAGLTLPPPAVGQASDGAQIAVRRSRPLRDIVRDMLKHSTNLTAEAIGLAASRRGAPSPPISNRPAR